MKKIFVTIMTLAAAVFQMQAIEDASVSIQLESDNNRTSVVTLYQAAIYTANEQNASEMLAQITNTTTAVNIYAIAPYGNMAIMGTNDLLGTYVGFTTNSRTNYSLTFGGVSGSPLYLIDHGVNPIHIEPIVENGVYNFTATASSTINDRFEISRAFPVTLNAYGWASFAGSIDLALPTGLTAYKGALSGDVLNLTEVADIPANTGVILNGTAGEAYNLSPITDATADVSGNDLKRGALFTPGDENVYVLSGEALYQYVGTDPIPANKAYLQLPGSPSSAPRHISLRFDHATGAQNVEATAVKAEKFMEDGQVLIKRGENVYNLQGQIVK